MGERKRITPVGNWKRVFTTFSDSKRIFARNRSGRFPANTALSTGRTAARTGDNMPDYAVPRPVRGLKAAGKALWRTVCDEWELAPDSEELVLLAHACRSEDIAATAQAALDEHGLTYEDRFGTPKERPEARILRQQRSAVASLVKQIGASQMSFRRLELATERHVATQTARTAPRDRRGGGARLHR